MRLACWRTDLRADEFSSATMLWWNAFCDEASKEEEEEEEEDKGEEEEGDDDDEEEEEEKELVAESEKGSLERRDIKSEEKSETRVRGSWWAER